jgi:hypothetical protein
MKNREKLIYTKHFFIVYPKTMENELPVPNRWHTTVSVEIYINNRLRYIKWFSDLQMAYIWVAGQERVHNETLTYNRNFVEFADAMDRRWQIRPNESCAMATSTTYRYRIAYEPDVPYRPGEQQTIQPQDNQPSNNLDALLNQHNNRLHNRINNRLNITTTVAVNNIIPLEILNNQQNDQIQFVFHP